MSASDLLEERIRETLATRAAGVEATPALWGRVQREVAVAARRRWAIGAAAAVAILAVVAGVSLLVVGQPPVQIVDEPDEEQSSLEDAGAFDRGYDETLQLDPDTDQRLHGRVIAELDVDADAVAVASDGAIGIRRGTVLTIIADGQEIATR